MFSENLDARCLWEGEEEEEEEEEETWGREKGGGGSTPATPAVSGSPK
jgi:hypothetical protein